MLRLGAIALLVVTLALTLRSATVGFATDDHAFRAALASRSSHARGTLDLFRFQSGDKDENELSVRYGHLPWWSAPDLKIHFLRPLTSALFAADVAVFGDHPVGYHLDAIAWYLVLVLAVGLLFRRLFPAPAALAAVSVYALRSAHVMAWAWPSARHLVVGALPAVLALHAHIRAREDGWRPGFVLAPLLLVVGLAGSEAALAAVVFWAFYEWAHRRSGWAPVAIGVVYLVAYKLLGGGVVGSGGYHDPLGDPLGFARVAVVRVPELVGDALLGIHVELAEVVSPGLLVGAGCLAAALGLLAWRGLGGFPALRWLVPAAVCACIVGSAGFPSGRVLVLPDVGFAALVGVLMYQGVASRRWYGVTIAAFLCLVHVVLAPLLAFRGVLTFEKRARAAEAVARSAVEQAPDKRRLFIVAASDPLVFLYPRAVLADTEVVPRCWAVLSAAKAPHRLTRRSPKSFLLEPLGRSIGQGPFEQLFRDERFAVGDQVRHCGARIEVSSVDDAGRPTAIVVATEVDEGAFFAWKDGALHRIELPAVGESVELPWSPGPTGIF